MDYNCVRWFRRAMRSPRRVWLGRLAFTAVLAAVLGFVALGPPERLDTGDKLASIAALVLAGATLVLSMSPVRPAVTGGLDEVAVDLAGLAQRQWAREAAVRLVRRPQPLPVRWSSTWQAAAPAGEVFGTAAPPGPRAHSGDVADLAITFRGLPAGRLVVVGAAGSGKTVAALLLTLDLLAARRPGEPVAVLLPAASWDPHEHLDHWLARRLGEEYPALTDQRRYGDEALLRLVRAGQVLPVLDGLDEMPRRLRSTAIAALNTVAAGRPVVLTCRSDVFAEAVATAGTPLDRAAVIEMKPVTAAAAAPYLPAGQLDGQHRWARVLAELRDRPDGTLARALSTPLMLYLARTVYGAPTADPAHLVDPARFTTVAQLQAHLLDQYLPAAYADTPAAPPDPGLPGAHRFGYDAEQARAWLTFLAAGPHGSAVDDLAWWQLPRCVARWRLVTGVITGATAGLATGLATATATGLVAGPGWGLFAGLSAGLWVGLMCVAAYGFGGRAGSVGRPRHVRLRPRSLLSPTRASLVRGVQCAVIVGLEVGTFLGLAVGFRHGPGAGVSDGIAAGLLVGLPVGVVELSPRT